MVDTDAGTPVSTATATWVRRDTSTSTLVDAPFAAADTAGKILLTETLDDHVLLCRAQGYVPQTVQLSDEPKQRIAMQRCATLSVSVVDEIGRGVSDALVVLTHQPWGAVDRLAPSGIGHPLTTHPRWCTRTDPRGESTTDELPPGRYYLNVLCATAVPADETAANGVLDLAATELRMTVTVQEAHGACFQCPSRSPVKDVTWSIPRQYLVDAPRVTARLAG
ncbi:MAG TPA: carboxypeptidase-like regulatory domain-containing protein, partial [Planctomycetota bacterium]